MAKQSAFQEAKGLFEKLKRQASGFVKPVQANVSSVVGQQFSNLGTTARQVQNNAIVGLGRSPVGKSIVNFQRGVEQRNLPRVNLQQYTQGIKAPVPRTIAGFGAMVGEEMINLPQRLSEAGGRAGLDVRSYQQGRQLTPQRLIGTSASIVEPLFDIATLGGGSIIKGIGKNALKQVGKQTAKQTLKQAVKTGAIQGAGYGSIYGGLRGLSEGEEADPVNFLKGVGGGALFGGVLGGAVGGAGSFISLIRRTPEVEKELIQLAKKQPRKADGTFTFNNLKKPKGMPKAQWDFQIKFNKQYKRNPYTPVYPDDLKKALSYEAEKKGVGLSIRDVNKDKNPLGLEEGVPQGFKGGKDALPESTVLEAGGGRYELKSLNTTDDVMRLIKTQAKETDEEIRTARRGKITFEETRAAANSLGTTVEQLKARPAGKAMNDAEIVRAGDMLKTKFESLNTQRQAYQQALETGTANEAQRLQLLSDMQEASLVMSKVLGAETEAGRALNAIKVLKQTLEDPTAERIRLAKKYIGDDADVDKLLNKFNELDLQNPEEAYKFIRSLNKPNFSDKLLEYWYNSILSSPSTHLINSISNSIVSLTSPVERLATAGVEAVTAGVARRPRQAFFGEGVRELYGIKQGFTEGVRKAITIMLKGYSMEDVAKLELRRPQAIGGIGGALLNIPSRGLIAADAFFKSINYSAALHAEAYRLARAKGAKGKELAREISSMISNPPPVLMNRAKKIADYKVFQKEPGEITKKVLALRGSKVAGVPVMQFIIPFVQTPVNLLKFGLQRTPLGFVNAINKTGIERSEAIAQAFMGSALAAAIAMYLLDGKISGAPPRNKTDRDTLYEQGWQPFSLKIGNKWISYQRLEPFNQIFTQIALIKDAFVDNKEAPITEKVQQVALGIGSNLTSQSYMSGIGDIINAIEDPERYGGNFVERQISGLVPFSSAFRTVARATDPTVRDPQGITDAVKANIPGLSQQLPAKQNVFGKDIVREGGAIRQTFPIKYTTEKGDVKQTQENINTIRGLREEAATVSLKEKRVAEKTYQIIKSLPQDQRAELWLSIKNKKIKDRIKDLAKEESKGLTGFDNQVKTLPITARAKYIQGQLQGKTPEEKAKLWLDWKKKGIITSNVIKEMRSQMVIGER